MNSETHPEGADMELAHGAMRFTHTAIVLKEPLLVILISGNWVSP